MAKKTKGKAFNRADFAREMASKGGQARAAKLTPQRRSEIAKAAIAARWAKVKGGAA